MSDLILADYLKKLCSDSHSLASRLSDHGAMWGCNQCLAQFLDWAVAATTYSRSTLRLEKFADWHCISVDLPIGPGLRPAATGVEAAPNGQFYEACI